MCLLYCIEACLCLVLFQSMFSEKFALCVQTVNLVLLITIPATVILILEPNPCKWFISILCFILKMIQVIIFSLSVSKKKSSYCEVVAVPVVQNFYVVHHSKCTKGINTELGILAHYDKLQLQDKEYNSESYIFGVMPLFNCLSWKVMQVHCNSFINHVVLQESNLDFFKC